MKSCMDIFCNPQSSSFFFSRSIFLRFCKVLRLVSSFGGFLGAIANFSILQETELLADIALRLYAIIFSIVILVAELASERCFGVFPFMESWIGRGFFISLSGLLIVAPSTSHITHFRVAVSYYLLVCGGLYVAMGFMCFRQVKQMHLNRIKEKEVIKCELDKLEAQRQQIDRLVKERQTRFQNL